MERTIIRLDASHRDAAITTLAAAFQDDPAMAYMLPDPAVRPARLTMLMRWFFDEHLKNGVIFGTPGAEAVTLWRPPGQIHAETPLWDPGALRFVPIFRLGLGRALRTDAGIHAHLPEGESWFYLKMAGVRPDCQGKGLGGLTIRTGLAEAAGLGLPAVLETATPSNVGLYQRLGFGVRSEWDVAKGGPHFWTMVNMTPGAKD